MKTLIAITTAAALGLATPIARAEDPSRDAPARPDAKPASASSSTEAPHEEFRIALGKLGTLLFEKVVTVQDGNRTSTWRASKVQPGFYEGPTHYAMGRERTVSVSFAKGHGFRKATVGATDTTKNPLTTPEEGHARGTVTTSTFSVARHDGKTTVSGERQMAIHGSPALQEPLIESGTSFKVSSRPGHGARASLRIGTTTTPRDARSVR